MPDELIRVRDLDTGHERSIHPRMVPHGNYEVLDEPAAGPTGEPLPAKFALPASAPKSAPASSGGKKKTGHKATNENKES